MAGLGGGAGNDSDDEGSFASVESRRAQATRSVKCKYLAQMEKIPMEVKETEHLLLREDLYAKLSADGFEHFTKMSEELQEEHGRLAPLDDYDHFFALAVECGWEGDGDEEKARAVLHQQDKVIAAVLISKLGRWRQLALTFPKEQIGRSIYLLRALINKLAPPALTGLSTGLLWSGLDNLLTLEMAPSRLNFESWLNRVDFHLASMRDNQQEPSDAQLVGRVLAQLQKFTSDRWASRAEAIQATMMVDANKSWDSLKSKILDFAREDQRLRKMTKANASLYLGQQDRAPGAKQGGRDKAPYKAGTAKPQGQDKNLCSYCGKPNHKVSDCRKKKWDEDNKGPKKTYAKNGEKGKGSKYKQGGTEIVALVGTTIAVASKEKDDCYILDSGASIHATNSRENLHDIRPCNEEIQSCGTEGPPLTVKEIGTLRITLLTDSGSQMTLEFANTYFSAQFAYNLISVPRLLDQGHSVVMTQNHHGISLHRDSNKVAYVPLKQNSGGLFCLTPDTVIETGPSNLPTSAALHTVAVANAEELEKEHQERILKLLETSEDEPYNFLTDKPHSYEVAKDGTIPRFTKQLLAKKAGGITMSELLHLIFGHAAHKRVYQTLQKMEQAPTFTKTHGPQEADVPCRTCLRAKMKASRKPVISRHRNATRAGQLIHFDMHALEVETDSGDHMWTVFVDAWSKMYFVFFHKSKKDNVLIAMLDELLTKLPAPPELLTLQEIFSDNAKEYIGTAVQNWCQQHKVAHTLSSPYFSHQNGLAESPGFHLMDTARAMLRESEVPDEYIHYAIRHATDLHNNMVNTGLPEEDSIPYTRHYAKPPSFAHLLPFGSYVCCFVPEALREAGDFKKRGQEAVYLGRSANQGYASGIVALYTNGKTVVTPSYKADPTLFPLRQQQAQRYRPFAHPFPVTGFGKDCDMEGEVHHKKAQADSDWVPSPKDADSDSDDEGPPGLCQSESSDSEDSEEEPSDHLDDDAESSDSDHDNQRPKSRVRRSRFSPPHSGGKVPATRKAAEKLKDQAAAKPLKKSKAAEPKPPAHSTRSKAKTALAAGNTNAEEKCKICFEEPKKEDKDQKRPYLRMKEQNFEDVQARSQYMLFTAHTSFGVSKIDTQGQSEKPKADPRTITEACRRQDADKWIEAADTEWENLIAHDAYEWVHPPKEAQVISTTMVFKKKITQTGALEKFKARLCARGDQQEKEEGEERFSPVTRLNLLRLTLATAVEKKLHLKTADINGAYLYAPIGKKDVYCRPPPGFRRADGKVMKLKKSLYGLGSSGRAWYQMFTGYLLELGFEKAGEEGTVFYITSKIKNKLGVIKDPYEMTVVTYVDDTLTTTNNLKAYEAFISKLNEKFLVSHEEDATSFIGALITYDREKGVLILSQEKFIYETLRNFSMENATPISTPMESKIILSKEQCPPEDNKDPKTVKSYQCLIGSLMWLTSVSRPDLTYATIKLARYASNPGQLHIQAALRILRYLNGTRKLGICYRANQGDAPPNMLNANTQDKVCTIPRELDGSIPINRLFAYADASNLDDYDTCRSTSGMLVFLCGLVAWGSQLIKIITLSTTEAEYNALSQCVKLVMYLRAVLADIGSKQTVPTPIGEDNEGCLHLAVENRHAFDRTRHIAAKRLFVIQGVNEKICEIKKCPTLEMLADFMTKPQPKDLFLEFRKSIMGM